MTKISKNIFNILIEKEPNRRKGEISSKTGRDYEDKASFFILTRFNKLLKVKSKIVMISFNGLEDLDIFDNNERIFSFQIKTRKHIWTKRDPELVSFLGNCLNRFKLIKDLDEKVDIRFYFFTNMTCDFIENWNRLHKDDPDQLHTELPAKIKDLLKNIGFSKDERNRLFSKIQFFPSRISTFLEPYIDKSLLIKFREFKNKYEPGDIIDFIKLNEEIFHEKRLMRSRIYEPAYEKDILISNILEVDIPNKILYCAEKREKLVNKEIQDFLFQKRLRISYLLKYSKIYCFHNFDKKNPLTQFLKKDINPEKINLEELEDRDKIRLLNDWLYNYLKYIGMRYNQRRNHRYFYFSSEGNDKYIYWNDLKAKKVKEWKVVKKTENFYENLGAEIRFNLFEGNLKVIIIPRLFFSTNGKFLLDPKIIREIEKTYRKPFMKNDFLRRRFFVILSYIRGDVKEKKQQTVFDFNKKSSLNGKWVKKWNFYDKNVVVFKDLIKLEADFKPNIEATSIPEDQRSLGGS